MSVHKKLMQARIKLQSIQMKKSGVNKFAGYEYFELADFIPHVQTIFNEIYYTQNKDIIRNSIDAFFNDLFNRDKSFTQVDLDLVFNIYKSLDKNVVL